MDNAFKAIADPTRRLMIDELAARDGQTLYELCARLIMKHHRTMSRQAIEKHLGILEEAGLVRSERQGKYKTLVLDTAPLRAIREQWLNKVLDPEGRVHE